ncbi:hypothetical protein E4U19_007829 [Claviceps sp. Clav32 group G5]|nr:hypothetical protein E4U19_007829 [Claviceps sp. Clav32 group G5]
MQQQLSSLMSALTQQPASTPPASAPARKALPFNHIFDGDKTNRRAPRREHGLVAVEDVIEGQSLPGRCRCGRCGYRHQI